MAFFAELKRRNVIRVGIAYVVVAWVVAQVAEFAFENFGAPDWVLKSVVVMLILGLPLVLVFAWAFELTPEGIKLEKEVDRTESITSQTGRKLDRTIIVVLLIALGWFAWDKFGSAPEPAPTMASVEETTETTAAEPEPAVAEKSVAVLPVMSTGSRPVYVIRVGVLPTPKPSTSVSHPEVAALTSMLPVCGASGPAGPLQEGGS